MSASRGPSGRLDASDEAHTHPGGVLCAAQVIGALASPLVATALAASWVALHDWADSARFSALVLWWVVWALPVQLVAAHRTSRDAPRRVIPTALLAASLGAFVGSALFAAWCALVCALAAASGVLCGALVSARLATGRSPRAEV